MIVIYGALNESNSVMTKLGRHIDVAIFAYAVLIRL
jgi:hypothetical protein